MHLILPLFVLIVNAKTNVREISSTSCEIIRVNLALGMTTQIVLEQTPKGTLYADKKHFKVLTNELSPRSLAIIPVIDGTELNIFRSGRGQLYPSSLIVASLDKSFQTNLFVFFENNNQLMFGLRFVEKNKADRILKVNQVFKKDCVL